MAICKDPIPKTRDIQAHIMDFQPGLLGKISSKLEGSCGRLDDKIIEILIMSNFNIPLGGRDPPRHARRIKEPSNVDRQVRSP